MVEPTGNVPKKPTRYGENVIRIHENPKGGVSGHLAAAFMGAVASIDFAQLEKAAREGKILRDDMPSRGSGLTINQHTFQDMSIRRFCNDGVVDLYDKMRNIPRLAKPDDRIFCAVRAWEQRSESGYMKRIEDEFQELACEIVAERVTTVDSEQKHIIDNFYALWYMRSRLKYLPAPEFQVRGVNGYSYTKEQEERLEHDGRLFAREGGKIPARQINGLHIQFLANDYAHRISGTTKWKIIMAQEGEFVVPDVPSITAIPLTPMLSLISTALDDGIITTQNVAELNLQFRENSWEYFFARDLSACP